MLKLFHPFHPTFRNLMSWMLVILLLLVSTSPQTQEPNRDPMNAHLITSDIPNFWRVFDKATLKDAADLFQREYLDVGSPGLRAFVQARIKNGLELAAIVASHPQYYAAIRQNTLAIDQKPEIKQAIQVSFRRLKEIYPEAIFPDVYFVIGRMNSAGTPDGKGLLIGVEMNARDQGTPVDEMDSWERAVIGQIGNLPHIVAHELIHIEQQQANPRRGMSGKETLLAQALGEGGADFLGEMISGGIINRVQRTYGNEHERALWAEFSEVMHGTDSSHWLYDGARATDRPADMGYYEGYKICEAFYKRASDKREAIRHILAISDPDLLLKQSGYGESFASGAAEP